MIELHFNHWIQADRIALGKVRTFKDLAELAISILARIPGHVEMVSGPISTGGVGSIDGNRKVFERAIEILVNESKVNIFSQMPFEDKMVEFYKAWHAEHPEEKYCTPILDEFYEPIFSSGKVAVLHFINGWESSFGAKWEHDSCSRWNIMRKYLSPELSQRALTL
jgi:hypothetical protein